MAERIRGRLGIKIRKQRLAAEPLCRKCKDAGKIKVAETIDHIIPLAFGGSDVDENVQALCEECHAHKTALEAASQYGASFHPDWLKPSAIPLTIVCGPPCSGKSTYVAERAADDHVVIDLDTLQMSLDPTYRHWSKARLDKTLLSRAVRARNELLGSLSRRKHGRAWFIVSAPTQAERDWWHKQLGGDLVYLHPGVDECKRRAILRGTPLAQDGVDRWEHKAKQPWEAQKRKPTIGLDGWPTE
jgi:hypothetical protein